MNDLEKARGIIDNVDKEMAALFIQRMKAVETVADYKRKRGLPVLDTSREASVIEKNARLIEDSELRSHYICFLQSLMDISKQYQSSKLSGMKVAFCGVEGAFANIAAKRIFPTGNLVSFGDFASAYHSVLSGECDCCVLPIENSFAGEVGQVLDLMFSGSLYINGVYSLPVTHNLLGTKDAVLTDVKKVLSHPQALMQCSEYISKNGFKTEEVSNTAVAAKTVSELNHKDIAAIASRETAELYHLKVLDHDINESSTNTTRFAVFSRVERERIGANNKFILLFTVNNVVGALAKAVNIISSHGFDMRVLRSRPVKDVPWQYYFYVEAEGDQTSEEGQRMLRALSVCCDKLKVVGHYSSEIDLSKNEGK